MSTTRNHHRRLRPWLAGSAIMLALAVALGGPALVTAASSKTVEMLASTFSPAGLKVDVGTKVVFKNTSQLPHTATADNGSFDTGMIGPGESKSIVLKKTGEVAFHCQFHGAPGGVGQSGTITVSAAGGTAPRPTNRAGGDTSSVEPPASDTPRDLPGAIEGVPLAAFGAAGLLTVLVALVLDGAGRRARSRRS